MLRQIILPNAFSEGLARDHDLSAAVTGALADVANWFETSGTPFFRDYTDHGVEHLNGVLEAADQLMTPESKALLSARDYAALTLAVLFHDSALHLSEEGFRELILGSARENRVAEFDRKSWPDLWGDFLFAARRWDDRKKGEVFGVGDDGRPRATVRDPLPHLADLSKSDEKLIGEFLRTHHARLAHEFALFGVPGPVPDRIKLDDTRLERYVRDMAGLIARSHGMSLRPCCDYLRNHYGSSRDPMGFHAPYLMAVIRISDYLQLQATVRPGSSPAIAASGATSPRWSTPPTTPSDTSASLITTRSWYGSTRSRRTSSNTSA